MKSLNAIASTILNNTFSGTYANSNYPLSMAQCKDDVSSLRARMVAEMSASGSVSRVGLTQTINQLEFEPKKHNHGATGKIPSLLVAPGFHPVERVCFASDEINFHVVMTSKSRAGTILFVKKSTPIIYIGSHGEFEIDRCSVLSTDKILFEAVMSDPRQLGRFGGEYSDDALYPMPMFLTDRIEGKLVNDYARTYRLMNHSPADNGAKESSNEK